LCLGIEFNLCALWEDKALPEVYQFFLREWFRKTNFVGRSAATIGVFIVSSKEEELARPENQRAQKVCFAFFNAYIVLFVPLTTESFFNHSATC